MTYFRQSRLREPDRGWTKEVQIADGPLPKPPSLSAAGNRSKRSGRAQMGRSVTQSNEDILMQMQRQTIADATIYCGWRQPGSRLGTYRPDRPASQVFPAAEPEAIPTWSRPLAHDRPSTRALARVHRRRFQTDALPERTGILYPGQSAVISANELSAPRGFGDNRGMAQSGRRTRSVERRGAGRNPLVA